MASSHRARRRPAGGFRAGSLARHGGHDLGNADHCDLHRVAKYAQADRPVHAQLVESGLPVVHGTRNGLQHLVAAKGQSHGSEHAPGPVPLHLHLPARGDDPRCALCVLHAVEHQDLAGDPADPFREPATDQQADRSVHGRVVGGSDHRKELPDAVDRVVQPVR